jgi:hypothetical protein
MMSDRSPAVGYYPEHAPGPTLFPPPTSAASRPLLPPSPLPNDKLVLYDWCGKWLTGDEYYNILINNELYSKRCSIERYPSKTHPESTYVDPPSKRLKGAVDGKLYFVEGLTVGSEFGFPRVKAKKRFKWYVPARGVGRK